MAIGVKSWLVIGFPAMVMAKCIVARRRPQYPESATLPLGFAGSEVLVG